MVQLIDTLLVGLVLGVVGLAVLRYFINLTRTPKHEAVNCAGCNANCHPASTEKADRGLLKKLK